MLFAATQYDSCAGRLMYIGDDSCAQDRSQLMLELEERDTLLVRLQAQLAVSEDVGKLR